MTLPARAAQFPGDTAGEGGRSVSGSPSSMEGGPHHVRLQPHRNPTLSSKEGPGAQSWARTSAPSLST